MEGTDKHVGWIEQVKELRELQEESHSIVGKMVGPEPISEKASETPGHLAGQLTDLLSSAIGSARSLNSRLHNIQERF